MSNSMFCIFDITVYDLFSSLVSLDHHHITVRIASFNPDSSGNNIEVDLIILITIDFKIYSVNKAQIKFKTSRMTELMNSSSTKLACINN